MNQFVLLGATLRFLPQRPGKQHGEVLYFVVRRVIVSLEYDKDGDLVFMYSNRNKEGLAYVKVLYLSKIWKRQCAN